MLYRPAGWFALFAFVSIGSVQATLVDLEGAIDISVGSHACVLTNAGGVKCWGYAPLGDGTSIGRRAAGDVIGLTSGVSAIGVGRGQQTCAAMGAGGLKCWGPNSDGQVGDGTTTQRLLPVDVVGVSGPVVAVAGGYRHTCAVLASGGVKCWGANDFGQLGIGTTGASISIPQDVVGLAGSAIAISAGRNHTCVILSGNGAQCWGSNTYGELGDGSMVQRSTPVMVTGLPNAIAAIAAGGSDDIPIYNAGAHSCAVTASGGAKCWGHNSNGNLGDGSTTDHLTPFEVSGLTSGVADISAGGLFTGSSFSGFRSFTHTCAVTTGGGAKCWGDNHCSEVGDGGAVGGCSPYSNISNGAYLTPIDVVGLTSGVAAIGAGEGFTCALTTDTKVKCWGTGTNSLGYGGTQYLATSTPLQVKTGTLAQAIGVQPRGPIPIGSTGTVSAVTNGFYGNYSGNPVTFASETPSICSVSGSTASDERSFFATVTGIASGICGLVANLAGNAYYDPAPAARFHFRIGDPVAQTITFGPAPSVPVGGVGSLGAAASSGLTPVTFHTKTPSVCSVSGNIVTGISVGSCTVAANQGGDELYGPAPEATQTFPVTVNTGTHSLIVTKFGTGSSGTVTSAPAGIDCGTGCAGNFSGPVTLDANGNAGSKFGQWSGACSGTGSCVLPMSSDVTVGALFVIDSPIPRLANISTRGQVLTGNDVMIAGFINGGTTSKTVVITVAGPSLTGSGIRNPLANPKLRLVRSSDNAIIASNDDWQAQFHSADVSAIQASGFAPADPREPAIIMTLAPGAYTAIADGVGGGTGIGLVGVFEVDHPEVPLINISTRGQVLTGDDVMIAGFIIQGTNTQQVVVTVAGPSLSNFGITNPLANPILTIVRSSDNAVIATNDNWQTQTNPGDVAAIQNAGFAPANTLEPAVILTLAPGAYTAIVSGVSGGTGVGLVGVYATQ